MATLIISLIFHCVCGLWLCFGVTGYSSGWQVTHINQSIWYEGSSWRDLASSDLQLVKPVGLLSWELSQWICTGLWGEEKWEWALQLQTTSERSCVFPGKHWPAFLSIVAKVGVGIINSNNNCTTIKHWKQSIFIYCWFNWVIVQLFAIVIVCLMFVLYCCTT